MSALLKVSFGLLVIVCLMQFIEMAPQEDKNDGATKIFNDISEQLSKVLNDENIKKFVDGASSALSEGAKSFEGHMKEWKEKLEQIGEKKD